MVLAIAAFYFIHTPTLFISLYAASCLLDVADGYAARLLHQSSKFGAVLDMVTDRSTTAGLMCHLSGCYPALALPLQLLIALDLSSHYMQMYAALSVGATSHKAIDANQNGLLRLYYTSRVVLFIACFMNEMFFMALYAMYHLPRIMVPVVGMNVWVVGLLVASPIWCFKQTMNVVQLLSASQKLAALDAADRRERPKRSLPSKYSSK